MVTILSFIRISLAMRDSQKRKGSGKEENKLSIIKTGVGF